MPRRRSTPSVTLFPFLAVLICAMGALIFLLLVITRQIRAEQRAERVAAAEVVAPEEPPTVAEPLPLPAPLPMPTPVGTPERLPLPPAAPLLLSSTGDELGSALLVARRPVPEPEVSATPEPIPPPVNPNIALRAERQRLQATVAAMLGDLEATTAKLTETVATSSKLKSEAEARSKTLAEANSLTAAQKDQGQRLLANRKASGLELDALRKALDAKRSEPEPVSNRHRFMVYDGVSGTTRRPLVIECTSRGLHLVGTGITLTEQDLLGYASDVNPLRSAINALIAYYLETEPDEPSAYVLFVVRPDGTIPFYAGRQLLNGFSLPFGYELLPDSVFLDRPDEPEAAVERVRTALVAVQEFRRGPAVGGIPGGGSGTGEGGGENLASRREQRGGPLVAGGPGNGGQFVQRGDAASPSGVGTGVRVPNATGSGRPPAGTAFPGGDSASEPKFRRGAHGMLLLDRDSENKLPGDRTLPVSPWEQIGDAAAEGNSSGDRNTNSERRANANGSRDPNTRRRPQPNQTANGTPTDRKPRWTPPTNRLPAPERRPIVDDGPSRPLPEVIIPRSTPNNPFDNKNRVWGKSPGRDGVGIERPVSVTLAGGQAQIGTGQPFDRGVLTTDELLEKIIAELDTQALTWGEPPQGFYWIPRIRFRIDGGAAQTAALLRITLKNDYGLSTKTDVLPSPTSPAPADRRTAP